MNFLGNFYQRSLFAFAADALIAQLIQSDESVNL